jgi:hypothetical protein
MHNFEKPVNPLEQAFNKAKSLNPELTREEWQKNRDEALAKSSSNGTDLYEFRGQIMTEKPTGQDLEEIEEALH